MREIELDTVAREFRLLTPWVSESNEMVEQPVKMASERCPIE